MNAQRADEWAEAKRRCRLSDEALQMAKELGLAPQGLIRNIPAKSQPWKARVEDWVRELHRKRFGERPIPATAAGADESPPSPRRQEPVGPTRNRLQGAEEALWKEFESDAIDPETLAFELNELQRNVPISEGEIATENRHALKRQLVFREAAYAVTTALAKIPAVQKVMLFGSVAAPLRGKCRGSAACDARASKSSTNARTSISPCGSATSPICDRSRRLPRGHCTTGTPHIRMGPAWRTTRSTRSCSTRRATSFAATCAITANARRESRNVRCPAAAPRRSCRSESI